MRKRILAFALLLLAGCAGPAAPPPGPTEPSELLSCAVQPCSQIVIPAETWAEEPHVAVNPADGRHAIVAAPSYPADSTRVFRWPTVATTFDGGATWTLHLPENQLEGVDQPYNIASDVVLAFHPDGAVLLSAIVWRVDRLPQAQAYISTMPDVAVWRSDDGGRSFPSGVVVARNLENVTSSVGYLGTVAGEHPFPVQRLDDKDWLTIDPTDGRAYLFWNRLTRTDRSSSVSNTLMLATSDDGGRTWTAPREIPVKGYGAMADAHGGTVLVAMRHGLSANFVVTASHDRGATWSAAEPVAPDPGGNYQPPGIGIWPTPTGMSALLAVVSGNDSETVDLYTSDDAGTTWAGPSTITPARPTTKRHPTLALYEGTGAGLLTYYEGSEDDPDALHVYAQRIDAGYPTGMRIRLTDDTNSPKTYLMDYMGVGVGLGGAFAVWDDWDGDAMRIRGAALRLD